MKTVFWRAGLINKISIRFCSIFGDKCVLRLVKIPGKPKKKSFFWRNSLCNGSSQLNHVRNLSFVCVCVCVFVCVCVCVCVCVFIFFHLEGFFRLQDVQDIPEGKDQRSCVVNISWVLSAKFHHLRFWKCHISLPKTKTPAVSLLERKRYDIMCSTKRWYILI